MSVQFVPGIDKRLITAAIEMRAALRMRYYPYPCAAHVSGGSGRFFRAPLLLTVAAGLTFLLLSVRLGTRPD